MASFNFLKEWKTTIGGLRVQQIAQPCDDGDALHVITGFHSRPFVYFNGGSRIPFADVEKLQDDAFRTELARQHIAARVKELREAADLAEKALAEPVGQNAAEVRAELKQQMLDCPCKPETGLCGACVAAQAAIDALGPVVNAEARS